MKVSKWIAFLILILPITLFYFYIPIFIFPDSYHYLLNTEILLGATAFSDWYIIRGPSLSIYLFPFLFFFGSTVGSLLLATYFSFVAYLAITWGVITKFLKELTLNKFAAIFVCLLFVILILINPVLFGYFHALLTEFLAIFLGLFTCMVVWNWSHQDLEKDKKKRLGYVLIFVFLVVFSWFLKQPYISTTIFPILAGVFIAILRKGGRKNLFRGILVVVLSFISLFSSIFVWNALLEKSGNPETASDFNTPTLNGSIIHGLSNFRSYGEKVYIDEETVEEDSLLKEVDKAKMLSILDGEDNSSFKVFNVLTPSGEITSREVFYYNGMEYSFLESVAFTLKLLRRYPLSVFDSYVKNYLSAINVIQRTNSEQNLGIGLAFLYNEENLLWLTPEQRVGVQDYYKPNPVEFFSPEVKSFMSDLYLNIFKIFYLLLPFLWIYSLLSCINNNRKGATQDNYLKELVFILLSYALLHTLLHVFTGAIIDRYLIVSFPAVILAFILLFIQGVSRYSTKNSKKVVRKT
jgi:hypothetical protein